MNAATPLRRLAAVLGSAAVALACSEEAPPASSAPAEPKAVFLIVVDTLRADRLSSYGYDAHRTPSIDRLAASGVRFARAHSAASWTVPGMGAILTSRYPTQLGLVERPGEGKRGRGRRLRRGQRSLALPQAPPTLAGLLRARGFRTAAFVNQPMLSVPRGFGRGIDDWFQPTGDGEIARFDPKDPPPRQRWGSAASAYPNDRALVERFGAWLDARARGERVFAWIHLLTPHLPYRPPSDPAPDESVAKTDLYDAEVRAVDALVGALLEHAERHFDLDRSLVVLTSDHGEAFGEHGAAEHGNTLHREVVHVPLVIAGGALPRGSAVHSEVRTIDVLPTVLDLVGARDDVPSAAMGTSLVPLIEAPRDLPVYSEGMLYGTTERAWSEDGFKLLYDEGGERYALYATQRDPHERTDLAAQQPERVAAMRARLAAWHAELVRSAAASSTGAATPPTDSDLEALRALGYLEPDE